MTIRSVQWIDATGKTLYWYPDTSLVNWATSRVAAVERASPNPGIYDASLDDEISEDWFLFEGAAQPATWDEALTSLSLTDATSTTTPGDEVVADDTLVALSQTYGPKKVKTPNMEVEQFDPRTIQAADDRKNSTYPTFADFGFAVAKPNCSKYRK